MSGILLPAGCCCDSETGSLNPCSYCSDKTPVSLEVMFSLITLCTGCRSEFGSDVIGYKLSVVPPLPAGPYTLAQLPGSPCKYQYTAPATGEWTMTSWPDCPANPPYEYPFDQIIINAEFNTASIEIEAFWTHPWWGPMSLHGAQTFFFTGTKSQAVCDGPFSVTNGLTSCYDTPVYGGHGGLASVVANWT